MIYLAQANQTDFKEKSANRAGGGLIAESGVEWCPKEHTKNPTISARCFFLNRGLKHKKTVFRKYLTEFAFLWKNTRVKNCSLENFLSNALFNIQLKPHTRP